MRIFKILTAGQWQAFETDGRFDGAPIDLADGYVHASTADQAAETAAKHFAGADGLVLAAMTDATFGDDLRWEPSRGGQLFPHIYRSLTLADLDWVVPLPRFAGAHVFPEAVSGHVDPTRAQFEAFKGLDRDHPIEMLNLVRLRDRAAYPDGHDLAATDMTGGEAYRRYGAETAPILDRLGGTILWRGRFETTLIGPAQERWDHAFIARYPDAHAFLAMVTDPAYREAVVHRQAAVRTSRLLRCAPADPGSAFG